MSLNLAMVLLDEALANGGCTVDYAGDRFGDEGRVPGYVVGGVTPSLVIKASKNRNVTAARINQVAIWLDKNPHNAYGSWLDSETGLIHIDAVDVVQDLDAAIKLGRERGEIAVWDGINGKEVRL